MQHKKTSIILIKTSDILQQEMFFFIQFVINCCLQKIHFNFESSMLLPTHFDYKKNT